MAEKMYLYRKQAIFPRITEGIIQLFSEATSQIIFLQ